MDYIAQGELRRLSGVKTQAGRPSYARLMHRELERVARV